MVEETRKKAILVVDDDPAHLELVGARLGSEGYRLIMASSAEEAIKMVEMEKPGLVLLDIMMPGMSGFELLKKLKTIDSSIPVAMVTAVWDNEEGKRCFDEGAFEYITKPIDFDYLKTAVKVKMWPYV